MLKPSQVALQQAESDQLDDEIDDFHYDEHMRYQEELDRATVDNYDQWISHQWPSTGPSNVWDHYDVDYDQDGVAFDGWDKIGPGPKK